MIAILTIFILVVLISFMTVIATAGVIAEWGESRGIVNLNQSSEMKKHEETN